MKILVDANCILAWALGRTGDQAEMKRRVKLGYDGGCTDAVTHYDEIGLSHFSRAGAVLLDAVDVKGKTVLDLGCGTGIVSLSALDRGAAHVVGGDLADGMLARARAKATERGLGQDRIEFRQLDAEALPFPDSTFDLVLSSVMLEFAPDPARVVSEMVRVLAPGGRLALTTHGRGYYWEAIDATFRSLSKRHLLGYRPEVWQSTEREVRRWLLAAALQDVECCQQSWQEQFASGETAFDFFLATSSGWWLSALPLEVRQSELARVRDTFVRKPLDRITTEIVLATGHKARSSSRTFQVPSSPQNSSSESPPSPATWPRRDKGRILTGTRNAREELTLGDSFG